ncbi:MAG: urease accessory protein UreE [Rhodospirillales bacterium]|nr:urease accessory protein UreE [Rhodospirillales bacterium]
MRKAIERIVSGHWSAADQIASVTLTFDDRHRRRIRMTDDGGEAFLLDLAEAEHLNDGDGLRLDSGGIIRVLAAPEAVLDIRCQDGAHTARIAWHIGNRHIALEVLADGSLRIRADHVLAEMLRGLGAVVSERNAAFSPEPGAYATPGSGAGAGHDHHGH